METLKKNSYTWENRLSYDDRISVAILYLSGMSINSIGIRYNIRNSSIRYHLVKLGVYQLRRYPTIRANTRNFPECHYAEPKRALSFPETSSFVAMKSHRKRLSDYQIYLQLDKARQDLRKEQAFQLRLKRIKEATMPRGYLIRQTIE